jgi:DNA invertase Pin-like site-specific DNA recombinase
MRVFTDVVSGKRLDRPGLAELLDHARPGDRLCITRLDRLGRSLKELLAIVADLATRGIHLVSLDPSSAAGELVLHVFGSIAHFERRLISERTRDGIAAARERGRYPGRPPLDPETVAAARKLMETGLSPARTANSWGLAGQRLTELPQRCVRKARWPWGNSGDKSSNDAGQRSASSMPASFMRCRCRPRLSGAA